MLDKIGTFLYHKVFINISVLNGALNIHIEKLNRNGLIESNEKKFLTTEINDEIVNFIESYKKETPYFYISILDPATFQGAIPTCDRSEMDKFYDRSISKYKCYQDKWAYYTSKFDLDEIGVEYSKIGLDFIFSPFVVLAEFFKDKIDTHLSIFLLVQDLYLTISIFDNSQLLFAQHLSTQDNKNEKSDDLTIDDDDNDDDEEINLEEDSIDLDSVDVDDDLDDLDVFGDIEDLDSIEEIEEFADIDEDVDDEFSKENIHHNADHSDEEFFNEDYQRFLLIQTAVKNFYEDEKYNSKFIESIYIADSINISNDLKNYLEEEMFLSVYIRNITISTQISNLAQVELK